MSFMQVCEQHCKNTSKVVEALYPRLEPEQLQAISLPLTWISFIVNSFSGGNGCTKEDILLSLELQFSDRDVKYIGTNGFFIQGPPGTGKSSVINALIGSALSGRNSEEDVEKLLPNSVKRIFVVTHKNVAVDDILKTVAKNRRFKDSELVRIGVRGRGSQYNSGEVFRRKLRKERQKRNDDRSGRRGTSTLFPGFTEADITDEATVVFSTFGSLYRTEFSKAVKGFDMFIVEESGKLHDGDLIAGIAQLTGMKKPTITGAPLAVIMVGDEVQLPPYSPVDLNLSYPKLMGCTFFERFVSQCEKMLMRWTLTIQLLL